MIHYSFLGYMIATAIIMIVCVIAYRLLLGNKVRPQENRWVLLSIYGISFLIPLLSALIPEANNEVMIEIGNPEFMGIVGDNHDKQKEVTFSITEILQWINRIYFLGLFFTFLFSLLATGNLLHLLKNSRVKEISGTDVYIHNNKKLSSFSWCNKIFIYQESMNSEDRDLHMLVTHEKAHLDKGHWIDLALAQMVIVFQWFNPSAWFMRKELQRIHEYEADEAVLKSGIDEKEYQMLLIQNISGNRYSGLTDGLNNCSLKNRIIMMKKTKFKKDWVSRGMAVCGFAILGGFIIHIPVVAAVLEVKEQSYTQSSEKSIAIKNNATQDAVKSPTEFSIDGQEVAEETARSLAADNIESITIKKSDERNKVEIATKKASHNDVMDNKDTNDLKEKGSLESYPDAYVSVDETAEYEGGQSQLLKDLSKTIVYPEEAKEEGIQGRVVVRFQINTNGTISNCEVAYSQNAMLNEAALKAVENLPRKWIPAKVDGKPVASVFNMPVTFRLQADE